MRISSSLPDYDLSFQPRRYLFYSFFRFKGSESTIQPEKANNNVFLVIYLLKRREIATSVWGASFIRARHVTRLTPRLAMTLGSTVRLTPTQVENGTEDEAETDNAYVRGSTIIQRSAKIHATTRIGFGY